MSSLIASQPDSVDADRSGGSRSQQIPGNVKTAPGRCANTGCPRGLPLTADNRKGVS